MIWLAAIAICIAVAAFLLLRGKPVPSGWTAETDGKDYGTKVDATGSFDFPIAPDSVHYVTKECSGLSGNGLRLTFTLTADPGVAFERMQLVDGVETVVAGSAAVCPVLYFQRKGDDWSGGGQYEAYRWWATAKPPVALAPGTFTVEALFTDRWTAVETSNSDDRRATFLAALAKAGRVGFTFPGVTGYGHGCCATGNAHFTLDSFDAI